MPFVPSSQRLATTNNTQIQVTEAINPTPTPSKQMVNEDPETNNSQPNYENNNNDLEDLLLTVLDELDVVKGLLLEKGIVPQQQTLKPLPKSETETLINKPEKDLPVPSPHIYNTLPNRNAPDFSYCF